MYQETLKNDPEIVVIDGSLVDIMGTLNQNGKLNEPLYKAMEAAQEKGDNVYLYSSMYSEETLKGLGVDLDKFPVISKDTFIGLYGPPIEYMVLGKVIDDKSIGEQNLLITLSNEDSYIYPNKETYDFTRDKLPEGIDNTVMKSPKKMIEDAKERAILKAEKEAQRAAGGGNSISRRAGRLREEIRKNSTDNNNQEATVSTSNQTTLSPTVFRTQQRRKL